ncbi:hypothetical protein [Neisseria sp. Ec49-e6-T10]|uniref:hypothetical protein n=1 Tax=Neisseria sp. Ec49-e6-T10 TaxID=3140744 RepID=UPI003EB772AB
MSDKIYDYLKDKLKNYICLSPTLTPLLIEWIKRCDGYLFDTVLFTGEDTSEKYLIEKSIQLLDSLSLDASNEEFCELFSCEFEGLFFHAETDKKKWNCTVESYKSFKQHLPAMPSLQYLDKPHLDSTKVYEWLMLHIPQTITL